jgi:hypothetical protein
MTARWKVTVTYLGSAGSSSPLGVPPNVFFVEELEEIDPIIERGIDWRAIDRIVIELASNAEQAATMIIADSACISYREVEETGGPRRRNDR